MSKLLKSITEKAPQNTHSSSGREINKNIPNPSNPPSDNKEKSIMKKTRFITRTVWRWLALGITLSMSLITDPVMSADDIDPEADKILKSMSSYLAETKAFSMQADIDFEVVAKNGQKFQLSSFATAVLQRPDKLYIRRKGTIADIEFVFDGKTLTLYDKKRNIFAQIGALGTIDDAIRAYELETGIPAPGADLLFANSYAILSPGIESSTYLGTAYVNGIECHHLAFREDDFDWQLWVQSGTRPLPMKYVITSKWQTAAPQYEIRFRDWVANPQINNALFTFSAPTGAKRLETLPVNELDEFMSSIEEGK
ncbi:DUF2092 domain-containing protein [Gloeobacter morelensis]|uniref:DUF2092 domain-containing protein n=1 Tax=Gloeobacter morelensis MG652769 TaxID=2781736 RepID=A0ABY3PPG1_9CYAN|nr:DUF2092 domain-containing protein [Gloeobacter morelensis]UFP95576.1 DUF2092 domain-containing protein [Gloeobacter morelensis MG652769]